MLRPLRLKALWSSACVAALSCLILAPASTPGDQKDKMTVDQLISRHLESIGPAQVRSAVKTRLSTGKVHLVNRVGARLGGLNNMDGTAALASSGVRSAFTMRFDNPQYPEEQMTSDGKTASVNTTSPLGRSALGQLLHEHPAALKEGLIGGALSTAWPFLRIDQLRPKLEYRGIKKIQNRPMHSISYRPGKGSTELQMTLFFDSQTFLHMRTEYRLEIGSLTGATIEDSARSSSSYYTLTEEFDEFRVVDGLNLPHLYKLQLTIERARNALVRDWTISIDKIVHSGEAAQ